MESPGRGDIMTMTSSKSYCVVRQHFKANLKMGGFKNQMVVAHKFAPLSSIFL